MGLTDEDWGAVARAMQERMWSFDEVRGEAMTKAELQRTTGISEKSLDSYLAGNPPKQYGVDELRALSLALESGANRIAMTPYST